MGITFFEGVRSLLGRNRQRRQTRDQQEQQQQQQQTSASSNQEHSNRGQPRSSRKTTGGFANHYRRRYRGNNANTEDNSSHGNATLAAQASSSASTAESSMASMSSSSALARDDEISKFLESIARYRMSWSLEDRMLLFEGEFRNSPVFVRDIALRETDIFDGDLGSLQETLDAVQQISHPCLTRVVLGKVLEREERLVVLSQRAVESVADKISKSRSLYFEETLTKDDAINIALAVCEGGDYLHQQGIWQLNLKPSSVLVFPSNESQFKLSESCLHPVLRGASLARRGPHHGAHGSTVPPAARAFGASAVSSLGGARINNPVSSSGSGTINRTFPMGSTLSESFGSENPEYLAVEQLAGEEYISSKADVFSFGMLLWQLLHLRPAYPPNWGPLMILKSLQSGNRPHLDTSLVGMDSPLRRIIELCWATDPSLRPTFAEIRRMLLVARQMHFQEKMPLDIMEGSVMQPIQLRERTPRGSEGSFTVELANYDLPLHDDVFNATPTCASSASSSFATRPPFLDARSDGAFASDPALDNLFENPLSHSRPSEIDTSCGDGSRASASASAASSFSDPHRSLPHASTLSPACSESTEVDTFDSLHLPGSSSPSPFPLEVGNMALVWHAPTRQFIDSAVRELDQSRGLVGISKPQPPAQSSRLVYRSSSSTRSRGSDDASTRVEPHIRHEDDLFWVHEHNCIPHTTHA